MPYEQPPNREGSLGRNYDYVGVSSQAVDGPIAAVAAKQQGNITRVQLLGLGLDDKAIDALFPAERVIVELDSHGFHQGRIAFETDRERDAETLAHRYVTIRMTWERMHETPHREANRLHTILAHQRAVHAPSAA